ncbi:MAG: hypothetical protein V4565_05030 [Bacteroidota bacterium]
MVKKYLKGNMLNMNYTYPLVLERYLKLLALTGKLLLIVAIMFFIVYQQPSSETVAPLINEQCDPQSINSVSVSRGNCEIRDTKSKDDHNKQSLLLELYGETILRKKNKDEIPAFIITFFDSLSAGKFELANPGERWRIGDIMDFAVRKVYDPNKKVVVDMISSERKDLPSHQLLYFGIGKNMALLSYYSGGIRIVQHIAMIKFRNNKIVDFWKGSYLDISVTTENEIKKCIGKKRTRNKGNC